MYLKRNMEDILIKTMRDYPIILLTGARQVGKTTLLKHLAQDSHEYVTMDDFILRKQLEDDPILFFKNHPGALILDEIQYVPQSFSTLKKIVDEKEVAGQFLLTGSQSFALMEKVSESLAGRIAVFQLPSLSMRERLGISFSEVFLPKETYFRQRSGSLSPYEDLWTMIHRGSMPWLVSHPDADWEIFYQSYVQTYIERDVRQLTQVGDERKFMEFLVSAAARSAEMLNYQSIAKDIGVSLDTVKRWISILRASGIIYLLYPYSNNHLKRALKTPKLYFMDTGLLAYLTRWLTPQTLQAGAFSGNMFETFVVGEIVKSYQNRGQINPPLYYYRDTDQKEIDLIIEEGHDLYPIEIKSSANPSTAMGKNFSVLKKIPDRNIKHGTILCRYDKILWLKEDLVSVPIEYI